ncbi:hypothetical protein [uncultured Bacteroides sp.]|uniref:hypothetical protein n=1 Tax=uncultured Bacteroides sp. TaxID=162156 RepID=UPI00259441A1|nr:hypothetical protein [uncultured Bacteroides sp.]
MNEGVKKCFSRVNVSDNTLLVMDGFLRQNWIVLTRFVIRFSAECRMYFPKNPFGLAEADTGFGQGQCNAWFRSSDRISGIAKDVLRVYIILKSP